MIDVTYVAVMCSRRFAWCSADQPAKLALVGMLPGPRGREHQQGRWWRRGESNPRPQAL